MENNYKDVTTKGEVSYKLYIFKFQVFFPIKTWIQFVTEN